ncbi:MAG: lysophospholipid acyltransferase family protein [Croceibacterium sp.]
MHALRSLLFYFAFYSGSVFFVLVSMVAMVVTPGRLRWGPDGWSRYHRRCLAIVGIKVHVTGHQPPGPTLFAIKHESFFEAIDLPNLLDHPVPFGKAELYKIPGWGKVAKAYGSVAVARDQGAKGLREMLADARRFAATGRPLAIFPEGTRVPHGTRAPLQAGFAGIYKLLRLPVVPVAVDSGPLYHRWIKRPGTITLAFGEPIAPGLSREDIETRVLAAINVLNV